MDRPVRASDWQEVRRRLAGAKSLRQRAEMIVRLFGWPRDQVAHTPEWDRRVPSDMRDDRHRLARSIAPLAERHALGSRRSGETPEQHAARIVHDHPNWPRCEIAFTPEWYAKVRGEAVHGFGDVLAP